MYLEKLKVAAMASALFVAVQAHASIDINNISSLDTGAGQYGANNGVINVSWLSDNSSWLYVNGGIYDNTLIGTKPSPINNDPNDTSPFESWNSPTELNMTAGTQYTVDLDVFNALQSYGNPTGGRVEFNEVSDSAVSAVPEPATLISGVLMLLPFGASLVRILRKCRAA